MYNVYFQQVLNDEYPKIIKWFKKRQQKQQKKEMINSMKDILVSISFLL